MNIQLFTLFSSMAFLCLSLIMLIRNDQVHEYQIKMLHEASKKAKEDIKANRDWRWRYEEFEKVSYDEMVYKFWKPLNSFYKDKSFLK